MKVIRRANGRRRRQRTRGYLQKTAPIEVAQTAKQLLALLHMPGLHTLGMRHFSASIHGASPVFCKPVGPKTRSSNGTTSRCASALSRNGLFFAAKACC